MYASDPSFTIDGVVSLRDLGREREVSFELSGHIVHRWTAALNEAAYRSAKLKRDVEMRSDGSVFFSSPLPTEHLPSAPYRIRVCLVFLCSQTVTVFSLAGGSSGQRDAVQV